MKKLVEEVAGEGLESLLGERVTFFCVNYIYTGKLVGVNTDDVLLSEAAIVYETGSFDTDEWKDAQSLPHDVYIRTVSIESYMRLK